MSDARPQYVDGGPAEVARRVRSLWSFLRKPGEPGPFVVFAWPDGQVWLNKAFYPVSDDWPEAAFVTPFPAVSGCPAYVLVECSWS